MQFQGYCFRDRLQKEWLNFVCFFFSVSNHTMYLIMGTISLIIGSILNYIIRLLIISIQLGVGLFHQRLMHLILDWLLKLRRRIGAFLLTPEPEEPPLIQQDRRYPERQRHQPDRLMYHWLLFIMKTFNHYQIHCLVWHRCHFKVYCFYVATPLLTNRLLVDTHILVL